jgi:hypothetical protein
VPRTWREAKIVVIQKPGKADYTIPKAYRPIYLLPTIAKGLEKLKARRLFKYPERNDLHPRTQFGMVGEKGSTNWTAQVNSETICARWAAATKFVAGI